jgi:SAM-dependent methyltransferase
MRSVSERRWWSRRWPRRGPSEAHGGDERFSEENLAFWVPLLRNAAQVTPDQEILDVGCGTGGFARAIANSAPARVTGCDRSQRFIDFASELPELRVGTVRWVVGDAERLPFGSRSFDRVLLSLVLHQLGDPCAAVTDAFRVLRGGGLVLVRTIAPEDVAGRIPHRYFPRMAATDAARLPPVEAITAWLVQAGFAGVSHERRLRNKRLELADLERELRMEARFRYGFLTPDELDRGLERMRADAAKGDWNDPQTDLPSCRDQTTGWRRGHPLSAVAGAASGVTVAKRRWGNGRSSPRTRRNFVSGEYE